MISDVMTEDELCVISGHYTRDGLKTWLDQHKILYLIAKSGWPRVHRKALERAMGASVVEHIEAKPVEFNFEALK